MNKKTTGYSVQNIERTVPPSAKQEGEGHPGRHLASKTESTS